MDIKFEPKQKTKTIAFRIPADDYLVLEKIAEKNKVPVSFAACKFFYGSFEPLINKKGK